MTQAALLEALAEAFDAASGALRQRAALLMPSPSRQLDPREATPVDKARALHEQLGHRQAQVLQVLADAEDTGTNTGAISRTIGYDQPNVYITLRVLAGLGFVEKDETTDPHTYRLTQLLRD